MGRAHARSCPRGHLFEEETRRKSPPEIAENWEHLILMVTRIADQLRRQLGKVRDAE